MFTKRHQNWLKLFFPPSPAGRQSHAPLLPLTPTASSYQCGSEPGVCSLLGTGMTGENVLSPPLLRATKYVHAVRCLVCGHPRLSSPGQTWGSLANFRNDLSAQLLPSHWRRGRVWGGRGGAVREGDVCEGVPDISPSPPAVQAWWGLCAAPRGELSGRCVSRDPWPCTEKVQWDEFLQGAPWELTGIIFQNVLLGGLGWHALGPAGCRLGAALAGQPRTARKACLENKES